MKKTCIIYLRHGIGNAVTEQEELCKDFAKMCNLKIVRVFTDHETDLGKNRSELARLMEKISKGGIDYLVITEAKIISPQSVHQHLNEVLKEGSCKLILVIPFLTQGLINQLTEGVPDSSDLSKDKANDEPPLKHTT